MTFNYICLLLSLALVFAYVFANTFEWVNLTQDELKQWYTPTDLCMLESNDTIGFPQEVRAKNCSAYSRGSSRLFCSVGQGGNKQPCFTPMSNRQSFKRGIKGFTDASATPLTNAFRKLIRANMTLVFLGDSLTRQKISALECELLREHRRNKFYGTVFGILPCFSEYKIKLHDEDEILKLVVLAIGPRGSDCLTGRERRAILEPGVHVYKKASETIEKINNNGNGALIVANLGLWFNEEMPFNTAVNATLAWLAQLSQFKHVQNIVSWHETSSQHWVSTTGSGYFEKNLADAQENDWVTGRVNVSALALSELQVPNCCASITNTSLMADWRNDIVKMKMKDLNVSEMISYLPFADATRYNAILITVHNSNTNHSIQCTTNTV